MIQALVRSSFDALILREAEIIVGAHIDDGLAASNANLRALRRRDHALFFVEARLANAGDLFFNVLLERAVHAYASSQFKTILPDLPSSIVSKPSSNL